MKLVCILCIALTAWGQDPVFDAASVKPSESPRDGSSIRNQPGRFSTQYTTLAQLIQYALAAQDFQVVEGPGWINDARFDIVANFAPPDSDKMDITERIARIRARLRHLLEDRFQLQIREEQREMQVYALETEKSGVRMKTAESLGNMNMNGGPAGATLSGKGMTMSRLADVLSGIAHRPVNDETGLRGAYDLELKYSLDLAATDVGAPAKDPSTMYPSLFTAMKEQLGLRLTGKKGKAPVWVVVRAEKPSEN
jgi:uncharacterized protein (TIGR03435 family)